MRLVNYGLHPLLIWINKPVTHPVPHQYYQPHHYYHQYCRILTFNCSAKDFFACYATSVDTSWVRWVIFRRPTICLCEYVRSIINFHPRNQDVDFDMFGWIQNFSKRDVIALKIQYVYSALLWHTLYCCVIQQLVTSDGSAGTQNDPGHPDNEWGWLSRCLWGP